MEAGGIWRIRRRRRIVPREPQVLGREAQFVGFGFWGLPTGSKVVLFWGLPCRILNINHKKELRWSLWVGFRVRIEFEGF